MKGLAKLALKGALIGGELLIDWLTGKLERPSQEVKARAWTHAESEIKARAQRCAGHEKEQQCKK